MMNHARVKALKGNGKTTSNKAIKSGRASLSTTPRNSPMASLLTSPAHSAAPSQAGSDFSDDDDFDIASVSDDSFGSSVENIEEGISTFDAKQLIAELQDRKRNNAESRERFLELFISLVRCRYTSQTHEWLDEAATELGELFIRSANRGMTARERQLSLWAFILTVCTSEDADVFEHGQNTLRQIITEDDDEECKVWAIYALCVAVLYGGGSEEAAQETLDYLVDIVQTDGESIEAHDNGLIVAASLQAWAFVASHVDDLSATADIAMDAFVEQLDSTDVKVQSHAAACIALIFEESRNHEEETGEPFQLPYDPQRLTGRMAELAKQSSKSVSKKHRKELREGLTNVVTSLERGVGPGYSAAGFAPDKRNRLAVSDANEDGIVEFGYRLKLRSGNNVATIDTWSLSSRVDMLKVIFGGHLQKHIFINPVVSECLSDAEFNQFESTKPAKHPVSKGGKR
ncbi:interferon-related developmental regulator-domain-containing protein [Dactylonectria macrodidyma]|uniref:Interferon-related developmental regulator-domain-containing protein n=1 Tax=Dactylonectria macrodidyma TaxID=307937 RepID=A0A9P9J5F5_9HYPO|nr:interferon-related developmental regulator-domain-containing protein [Dactylonectria macrodidyma]